jgi:hypothetical protein
MRDNALVTAVTPESILVVPLLTDTCINCAESSCAKRGTPFPVDNPRALAVESGDVVSIAAKKTTTAAQAVFSLLFPIGFATAAFCAPGIAGKPATEGVKALLVLAGLAVASGIVLVVNRVASKQTRAEITKIVIGAKASR